MKTQDDSRAGALKYGELTDKIIGVYHEVYNELGHGFLESVYQRAMRIALVNAGVAAECEVPIPVWFRGEEVGRFRRDLVVQRSVLLELKAAQAIDKAHEAQALNYLRATTLEVALILNFGPKPQFRRLLLTNDQKKIRENLCKSVVSGAL